VRSHMRPRLCTIVPSERYPQGVRLLVSKEGDIGEQGRQVSQFPFQFDVFCKTLFCAQVCLLALSDSFGNFVCQK